jgi:hypothetical protein
VRKSAAATILDAAKNETTRTPVVNARCREAFNAMEDKMRDIKRRYFFIPPLTEADFIALGLSPADPVRTPSGEPTAQVQAELSLMGPRELGVRILYVTGSPREAANKEYRICYVVVAPGAGRFSPVVFYVTEEGRDPVQLRGQREDGVHCGAAGERREEGAPGAYGFRGYSLSLFQNRNSFLRRPVVEGKSPVGGFRYFLSMAAVSTPWGVRQRPTEENV